MTEPLWVEVDNEGAILRASDAVRKNLEPAFGPDLGLKQLLASRADLGAAIARQGGRVRVGLGHGELRTQYSVTIDQGGSGARLVLTEAPEFVPGAAFAAWAKSTQDAVVVVDADHFIVWANRALGDQVGYPTEGVLGLSFTSFRANEVSERTLQSMRRALLGTGSWSGNLIHRRSDGTSFPVRASYTAVEDEEGATTHYVVVCHDVQEESELELLDSLDNSAALLSRMGMGFAHDINNLASELVALAETVAAGGADADKALARVEELGNAAGEVGRQLLVLAGEGTDPPPSDLVGAGRDLAWLLIRASSRTRSIEIDTEEDKIWVGVRADAILRSLLRPALRAIAELPADRVIHVRAFSEGGYGVLSLSYEADSTERSRLRMLISDGAVTTTAGNILRTRAMGAGVQMQLHTEQSGDVSIRARAPLSDGPSLAPDDATGEKRTWKRVIVVEDNRPLCELMAHALRPLFDEVQAVHDGVQALEALEKVGDSTDLVIVDLMMPRLRGSDVVKVAAKKWPRLPFIAMSGAAPDEMTTQQAGVAEFLLKPFKLRDLRRAVYRVLKSG